MALVEAMACGCPVVASETGACPEITAGGRLLAHPHSPGEFAGEGLRLLRGDEVGRGVHPPRLRPAAVFHLGHSAKLVLENMREIVDRPGLRSSETDSGGSRAVLPR